MRCFALLLILCHIQLLNAQFPVGEMSGSFIDATRANRTVSFEAFYPSATTAGSNVAIAAGEFPVIIFGHGFVMSVSEYDIWQNSLVEEGYILVFPTTESSTSPSHGDFGLDISFLLNEFIVENASNTSFWFQHISNKSAFMGHSMGGGAAVLAAENNGSVNTIITLAAAETTPSAIAAAANITIPSLTLSGSSDCVAPPSNHQIPIYDAFDSSYKDYVEIIQGSHCQFSDPDAGSNCLLGEFLPCLFSTFISTVDQHDHMLSLSIPWLDYYLKEDCDAWDDYQNELLTNTNHSYMSFGTEFCCPSNLVLTSASISTGNYEAEVSILSNQIIPTGQNVTFHAGDVICLDSGFEVSIGSDFEVQIGGCGL